MPRQAVLDCCDFARYDRMMSMAYEFERTQRIAVLGGGPGGYEAALAGARLGAEVTLIERAGVGGSAVLTDVVPSKSLIATAEASNAVKEAADLGVQFYAKGSADKAVKPSVAISDFEGTTSVSTAEPPTPARSMSVTSAPSRAPARAASYPPGPPPRTAIRCVRSNS